MERGVACTFLAASTFPDYLDIFGVSCAVGAYQSYLEIKYRKITRNVINTKALTLYSFTFTVQWQGYPTQSGRDQALN